MSEVDSRFYPMVSLELISFSLAFFVGVVHCLRGPDPVLSCFHSCTGNIRRIGVDCSVPVGPEQVQVACGRNSSPASAP